MIHLDSSIVIRCLRGDEATRQRIASLPFRPGISATALAEVSYGAKNASDAARHVQKLADFVQLLDVVDFNERCTSVYASMRVRLRRMNKQQSEMDMLIAAAALANNASLATLNVRHFEHIEGLTVEDWR